MDKADWIYRAFSRLIRLIRGFRWTVWIRLWGGSVGRRLQVDKGATLRHAPRRVHIGDDVYLGRGVILDVRSPGRLEIGDRVKLMHYVVVGAAESVTIGADSQVAEHTSVRDSDHGRSPGATMRDQPLVCSPVVIGRNCWVGRGCAVLRGVTIADDAIVAANAVVRSDVGRGELVGGVPARVIGRA